MRKRMILIVPLLCAVMFSGCGRKKPAQETQAAAPAVQGPVIAKQEVISADIQPGDPLVPPEVSTQAAAGAPGKAPRIVDYSETKPAAPAPDESVPEETVSETASETPAPETTAAPVTSPETVPEETQPPTPVIKEIDMKVSNGDIFTISMDERFKLKRKGEYFTAEALNGDLVYGFVWPEETGNEFRRAAEAQGNEIYLQDELMIEAYMHDRDPGYYELIFRFPDSSSVLVLIADDSKEAIETVFASMEVNVTAAQDAADETPGAGIPNETKTVTVIEIYDDVVMMEEENGEIWMMEMPAEGVCAIDDVIDVRSDENGFNTDSRVVVPVEIFKNGEQLYKR